MLKIGVIKSVHGLKGAMKFSPSTSYFDFACSVDFYDEHGKAILCNFGKKDGRGLLKIEIEGISSVDEASKLIGTALHVKRDVFPPLEDGNYYPHDLTDLKVISFDSQEIYGYVVAVHNFGAGDILEVIREIDKKSEMFSMNEEIFPEVNLKEGFIVLNNPTYING